MNNRPNPIIARIAPFFAMAIAIVVFVIGIIISFYLFIFGAIAGLIFFAIAYLRNKFGKNKNKPFVFVQTQEYQSTSSIQGRTIDQDED